MDNINQITFFLLVSFIWSCSSLSRVCPRDKSRVVSRLAREKILSSFKHHHVPLAPSCRFDIERDMFFVHESNKVMEHGSKFTCDFCGKSFVSEHFLDVHFQNRHEEHIQVNNALCLADLCDIFRCDIVSGSVSPDYWDIALCMEDDMQDLHTQCQALVDQCIPSSISLNKSSSIRSTAIENICDFLTCAKFWDSPVHNEENTSVALYIVLVTMTCLGILIYTFIFYQYFYGELSDQPSYHHPMKRDKNYRPYRPYPKYSTH